MKQRRDIADSSRHGRLFELIRQDNLATAERQKPSIPSEPTIMDMQRFLRLGNQSLSPDGNIADAQHNRKAHWFTLSRQTEFKQAGIT